MPHDEDSTAETRARVRRQHADRWPVRRFALGEEPVLDLRDPSSAAERIAQVWALTQRAWKLAGRPMPDYGRHDMPGVVLRNQLR